MTTAAFFSEDDCVGHHSNEQALFCSFALLSRTRCRGELTVRFRPAAAGKRKNRLQCVVVRAGGSGGTVAGVCGRIDAAGRIGGREDDHCLGSAALPARRIAFARLAIDLS
jgi:hypothetical protein